MSPVINLGVPFKITGFTGENICEQGRNDGLILGPPEFHIMPILRNRSATSIDKIKDSTIFIVPPFLPHPIEHLATQPDKISVTPIKGFP